ncbi:MAG: hypothetical protein O3C60_13725 [Planctomycetota bacterium]|nr:hypothetical protein [Planctomycetota bacterium]
MSNLPPLGGAWEPVNVVCLDASRLQPGDVLLSGPGLDERVAGRRQLAEEAFARQAVGVVTAYRTTEPWAGTFVIQVPDALAALTQLAHWNRVQNGSTLVAVTGNRCSSTHNDRLSAHLETLLSTRHDVQRIAVEPPFDLVSVLASMLAIRREGDVTILSAPGDILRQAIIELRQCRPNLLIHCETDVPSGFATSLSKLWGSLPNSSRVLTTQPSLLSQATGKEKCQFVTVGTTGHCDIRFDIERQPRRPSAIRYGESMIGMCLYDLSLQENLLLLATCLELGMTAADLKKAWRIFTAKEPSKNQRRAA